MVNNLKGFNKLASLIASELRTKILKDRPTPGSRYLSEKDVVDEWACSRATAREALLLLEYEGLINRKPGPHGGIFIQEPSTSSITRIFSTLISLKNITHLELLEARIEIEA